MREYVVGVCRDEKHEVFISNMLLKFFPINHFLLIANPEDAKSLRRNYYLTESSCHSLMLKIPVRRGLDVSN